MHLHQSVTNIYQMTDEKGFTEEEEIMAEQSSHGGTTQPPEKSLIV